MVRTLVIETLGTGLHVITPSIVGVVVEAARAGELAKPDDSGLCTVFIRHTSASLLIQENADPSAKRDLEAWLNRLVPEHDPLYTHNDEGPDDMPAHVKAALTATTLSIPIQHGRLTLGRWQGIYLWEHRRARHQREVVVWVGK
ncbi:MAG: secondary thiamine-phosphate synthase enzyme YjbQ [Phycisphaerales bacterium]